MRGRTSAAGNRTRRPLAHRLLEREWELAEIDRALSAARTGAGTAVFIDGEPGSGKSELLGAGEDMAAQAGMRVLSAHAAELEREFPFGLVIQLFEPFWLACDADQRASLMDGPAQRAMVLFDGSIADVAAEQSRHYPIIHGLFWMTRHLAAIGTEELPKSPLAILVDDAHWSDVPSMRFLAYLAERVEQLPVAIMLTARQGQAGAEPRALASLRRAVRGTPLRAKPFSLDAITTIVHRQFPAADETFCAACAGVSGGNPFLLIEFLDKLREEEQSPHAAATEPLAAVLPQRVLDGMAAQLDAMPASDRALAVAVAVLGDAASVSQAASVAEIDESDAARAADSLAGAGLLHPAVPLSFVQSLLRVAVVATLSPLERAHLHGRAATVLAAEGAGADQIAPHLLSAPARDDEATIAVLRKAAAGALKSGQAAYAVALLERALAEHPVTELRVDLLAEIGAAEVQLGSPRASERFDQARRTTTRPDCRAELALAQAEALYRARRYADAATLLDAQLAGVPDGDGHRALELKAAYVSAASLVESLHGRARQAGEELFAVLPPEPSPRQRTAIAHGVAHASFGGAPRHHVRDRVEVAWGDGQLLGSDASNGLAWPLLSGALLFVDELERAIEICDAAFGVAADARPGLTKADIRCCYAWALREQGRIAQSAAEAVLALEAPADERPAYTGLALAALASCHIERGQLEGAAGALAELSRQPLPHSIHEPLALELRARLRLAQHRPNEALRDALDAGRALRSVFGNVTPGAVSWRSTAALAHLALGQPDRARGLAEEELHEAQRIGVTRVVIRNLRTLGLAVGPPAGIELLAQAVETGADYPLRFEYMHALVELGAALRRTNRRSDAREPLRRGLELSEQRGASVLAARARTELVSTRSRPDLPALSGLDSLTASQRRVAELAAQGLATRQIAEALFVTPKTVEFHLRQIYRKLDLTSRDQLAGILRSEQPDNP